MDDLTPEPKSRNRLNDIPIEITVSVGQARPAIKELLAMEENTILPLNRRLEDPVELYVGEKLIARGELEEMEGGEPGQLAVRLTEVAEQTQDLDPA